MIRRAVSTTLLLFALAITALAQHESPLQFGGDLRLRAELGRSPEGSADFDRIRTRMRLWGVVHLIPSVDLHARVGTWSGTDARAATVDLGEVGESIHARIAQLHLSFKPKAANGVTVRAGRFELPTFRHRSATSLAFDTDLPVTGIEIEYETGSLAQGLSTVLEAGIFTIDDPRLDGPFHMRSLGSRGSFSVGESVGLDIGLQYYAVDSSQPAMGSLNRQELLDANADFRLTDGWWNGAVEFEVIRNLGTNATATSFGASFGTEPGRPVRQIYYQWTRVESGALVEDLAPDDFPIGIGSSGHRLGLKWGFPRSTTIHLWTGQRTSAAAAGEQEFRFGIDLDIRF